MDRNFFYQEHAKEQQAELNKELATHHLLRQAAPNAQTGKTGLRLALRILPAAIAIGVLILFRLFG